MTFYDNTIYIAASRTAFLVASFVATPRTFSLLMRTQTSLHNSLSVCIEDHIDLLRKANPVFASCSFVAVATQNEKLDASEKYSVYTYGAEWLAETLVSRYGDESKLGQSERALLALLRMMAGETEIEAIERKMRELCIPQ